MKRGAVTGSDIPTKKMTMVVTAKLKELFMHADAHLKSIGRQRLLPAGIVITGGGSGALQITDIARTVLRLPAQVGLPAGILRNGALDASWAVSYGLCRWGFTEDTAAPLYSPGEIVRRTFDSIRNGFRSLLP
jgi:cell division protein FtsA